VLARVLEAHGIATTSISLVREHTEKIKPPRAPAADIARKIVASSTRNTPG